MLKVAPELRRRADTSSNSPVWAASPSSESDSQLNWSKFVALVAAVAIGVHLVLRFFPRVPPMWSEAPLFIALLLGGAPLLFVLLRNLLKGQFGSDFLAGVSILTAVLLREYLVATIVVLMLSGGTALEDYATRRASRVLEALAKRMPSAAHKKGPAGLIQISVAQIAVDDELIVLPHEICPVDGVVIEGNGSMNEAYLTGEPFEVDKAPGAMVLSGALNGEALLNIRATKLARDSRYARIMQVMEESQQRRPRLRRLGDALSAWYTPFAIGVAAVAWALTGSVDRFLAVVVIATPCPLLIAIPVAVIGAVSLSARRGIIVKNPAVLEQLDSCRTFIFDKTGTLTYGRPQLTEVICADGYSEQAVLSVAASLEHYSKHPLAAAIVEAAKKQNYAFFPAARVNEPPGQGLQGIVNGWDVSITGRKSALAQHISLPPIAPGLECLVFLNGKFASLLRFEDSPRSDSRVFLTHLSPHHQVAKLILVSGDRVPEVQSLAKQIGIETAYGSQTPEQKVELVRSETTKAKTVFIGDGINDAPAMQAATVGIAFGHENDITSEAADAVVLERSLGKVDELMHIGRRMRIIALQSAVGGMALSTIGMALAATGLLPAISGAVAQEFIDLAAVLNAVRVALPFRNLRDY